MAKIETEGREFAVCPYCGYAEPDSWELNDGKEGGSETECGHCELTFRYNRRVSVSYDTMPMVQEEKNGS
jgi:hypothetical protein